jgi:hypothetical protein
MPDSPATQVNIGVNPSHFLYNQQITLTVYGANFNANISGVTLAGKDGNNVVNWSVSGFLVVNSCTLTVTATPAAAATPDPPHPGYVAGPGEEVQSPGPCFDFSGSLTVTVTSQGSPYSGVFGVFYSSTE